ncbi:MAG: NADP-dependent phosphogluconate dehydrogenase [Sedimentisphaerales bacterium]
MDKEKHELGMVGLGVMGRNLVLNMADHGFAVSGYDKDPEKVQKLNEESKNKQISGFAKVEEFIASLTKPKIVMMLVPAGRPVDSVIRDVLPLLSEHDILIDAGNSFFKDTDERAAKLSGRGISYLGVGVSGGEHGARFGPSIMPGGPKDAYEHVHEILEAVAARVDNSPCVTWLGPGSAGHYVKMVHNGIEYGLMQLISETYDIMSQVLEFSSDRLSQIYQQWNEGSLNSFLIEITSNIFKKIDEKTHKHLVEVILDEAHQKGTGAWSSESALELQVAVPVIDTAVQMRYLSGDKSLRKEESELLKGPSFSFTGDPDSLVNDLGQALLAGFIISYSQGFSLLSKASEAMNYDLDKEKIAAIWRGGCIIRSSLLHDIMSAYQREPNLSSLLEDAELSERAAKLQDGLRRVVQTAAASGVPTPGMMSILSYYDSLRSSWLPANLIQAQRDYFGSHQYERIDEKGTFHTEWSRQKAG